MPEPVSIRDATGDDLSQIVELLAQLGLAGSNEELGPPLPPTYEEAFREIESDKRQRLLVLEVGGRLVGTLAVVVVPNVAHQGRPYGLIENVVIDERERGAGYGEALLQAAIGIAREAGCYKVSLFSNKQRPDAHRFYERLGFEPRHEGFRLDL